MRQIFFVLGVMLLAVPAVQAQNSGSRVVNSDPLIEGVFSTLEKQLIREFFGEQNQQTDSRDGSAASQGKKGKKGKKAKSNSMPPGLAKKKSLPPGLQKQLERNGKLPPGLEKRDLPHDLRSRLPRRHERYKRVVVDSDVVLIEAATDLVIDIIRDVVKSN